MKEIPIYGSNECTWLLFPEQLLPILNQLLSCLECVSLWLRIGKRGGFDKEKRNVMVLKSHDLHAPPYQQ